MKVLVTGATGYIGRLLIPVLHKDGHKIRALVRKSSNKDFLTKLKNVEIHIGDLTDEKSLLGIEKDIEYVYHMASVLTYSNALESDQTYFDINCQGTINLLKRFVGNPIKKFLYTSSSAAVGVVKKKVIIEDDTASPKTAYGKSKLKAEIALRDICEKHSIPYVIVRLTHVYGPGDLRDLYKIVKMIKKGIFPQVGFGPNLYPCVYLDDAVEGLKLAMEKGVSGKTYTITDKTAHDLNDIRRIVRNCLGIKSKIYPILPKYPTLFLFSILDLVNKVMKMSFPVSRKNIHNICSGRVFSIERAQKDLGFEPKVSLEEGLKKTMEYYVREKLL